MSALRTASVTALVAAAVCGSACGAAPRHAQVSTGPGPRFRGAAGWHVIQNGLAEAALVSTSAAANLRFAKGDLGPGTPVPSHTVASLPRNGIVIWAQFPPRRSSARSNKYFPPRTLPLHLAGSVPLDGTPEGFVCPRACAIQTLEASASGYDIAVWIFFGTSHPSVAMRSAANRELSLISIPGCPASPRPLTRGDLAAAERSTLTWLRAHYFPPARRDLNGARAKARPLSDIEGDSRFRTTAALCGPRADRIAAVTVTTRSIGLKNLGPKLLYFLAKTPRGWLVWRQG